MSISDNPLSRRTFLASGCALGLGCLLSAPAQAAPRRSAAGIPPEGIREALHYKKMAGQRVRCDLCPCSPNTGSCGLLADGDVCTCRVRFNRGGKLYCSNYGQVASLHLDPVEKNPLFHIRPGERCLALGTAGCNMSCQVCQNWQLSQQGVEGVPNNLFLPPERVVSLALERKVKALCYTYTEPVVAYEFVTDTAALARARGLRNYLVTGGYINPAPALQLGRAVDAVSVSLKALSEADYHQYCQGSLKTVQTALEMFQKGGAWVEVVLLVVPSISDDPRKAAALCGWIRSHLGAEVPLHVSRFFPEYRLKHLPPTPLSSLEAIRQAALEQGLKYVYVDNVVGHEGNNTYCPKCHKLLVQRLGLKVLANDLHSGRCPDCHTSVAGLWA